MRRRSWKKSRICSGGRSCMLHSQSTCARCSMRRGNTLSSDIPPTAKTWQLACVNRILGKPGVVRVNINMCMFGMKSTLGDGTSALAKKPTGVLTNS
eukprot:4432444-Karenia_brevis.AAC.1